MAHGDQQDVNKRVMSGVHADLGLHIGAGDTEPVTRIELALSVWEAEQIAAF